MNKKLIMAIGLYSIIGGIAFGIGRIISKKEIKEMEKAVESTKKFNSTLEESNNNLRKENTKLEEEINLKNKKNEESK